MMGPKPCWVREARAVAGCGGTREAEAQAQRLVGRLAAEDACWRAER